MSNRLHSPLLLIPLITGSTIAYGPDQPLPSQFVDATEAAGIRFQHVKGGYGERFMIETMGSGVALADLDGDGQSDLYFVQSGQTPGSPTSVQVHNQLYRNRGDSTFDEVAALARVNDHAYGVGVTAADYDNDGFVDLYVTNYGPNLLFHNNGDGTFGSVGMAAGVADNLWGSSAAWGDIDADGFLDLYVANYVDFSWENNKFCGDPSRDLRAYCHPDVYGGLPDRLFHASGHGDFVEIGEAAGVANRVEGKGLGVVLGDYDDDGDTDVYVANDSTRNFLYTNRGDLTFDDDALLAGVGYSEDGEAEAGMGTDWGDYDGDGRLDVVVTNLDLETNTLYRNLGGGAFSDQTFPAGLGEPSLRFVGFGTNWLDIDNDADLDLFVANGHIIDNVHEFKDNATYAQVNHLFLNEGGRLIPVQGSMGPGLALEKVSRGSAIGDIDGDGDLDIVVANNDQRADLLIHEGGEALGSWIRLRLVGREANRTGAGTRVLLIPDDSDRTLIREVKAGSSYCSVSELMLHVGLGGAAGAEISLRWPGSGTENIGRLAAGHTYVVHQGRGVVASS